MRELSPDTVIDGRYQVLYRLGSGGMADVYCAQDLQLGRKVALKLLHDRFAQDEEFVERFRREASSAAGLQHPHVVAVYDRGEWGGTSYIAMEFVDGRTLKQTVQQDGPLDPARAIDLVVQVLRAARFAHRRGVIHRDLKPHNVIVDEEGRAKVTDFGIARAGASDMTQTGSIMGTAQYLSPEQAQGHAVSAKSDLYAIGIVLFELLTGQVPFEADSAVSIALKQVNEPPIPPGRLNSRVPPDLDAVVLKALEKDPAQRFADADEFIAALEAVRSRLPATAGVGATGALAGVAATPRAPDDQDTGVYAALPAYAAPPPPPRAPRPERTRPRRWPWGVLVAVIAAAAVAGVLLTSSTKQVHVPDVVGSSVGVAQQKLKDEGFQVNPVRDNSAKPRNTVIGQDPSPESTVDKGSQVTITISDGPAFRGVPDVTGQGRRAATKLLTGQGFVVKQKLEFSDEVSTNKVIAQSLPASSQAQEGATITLTVSKGKERAVVPDLVGQAQDAARAMLLAAGLQVTPVLRESSKEDPGTILAQDPPKGTKVLHGSAVKITIAQQPQDLAVPDVVGVDQSSAIETLSGAGFQVDPSEVPVTDPSEDGVVQSQSPVAQRKVRRGSRVSIVVGRLQTGTGATGPASADGSPPVPPGAAITSP